jgi:hypothetical protein
MRPGHALMQQRPATFALKRKHMHHGPRLIPERLSLGCRSGAESAPASVLPVVLVHLAMAMAIHPGYSRVPHLTDSNTRVRLRVLTCIKAAKSEVGPFGTYRSLRRARLGMV